MATDPPAPPALPDVGSTDWYAWAAWMHAQATGASTTYLPLPTGTKATGKTPTVQSDGSVQWAAAAAGGGISITDNGNGLLTLTSTGSSTVTDLGNGLISIAA